MNENLQLSMESSIYKVNFFAFSALMDNQNKPGKESLENGFFKYRQTEYSTKQQPATK